MFRWIKKWLCKEANNISATMNLAEFVSLSLLQICKGIEEAQKEKSTIPIAETEKKYFGPVIAPYHDGGRKAQVFHVKFDIAITHSNTTNSASSIKPEILVIGGKVSLSEEKSNHQTNSTISRIEFSIPIIYPTMPIIYP